MMNKKVFLCLACLLGIATLAGCIPFLGSTTSSVIDPSEDAVEHITNKYAIPEERVLELAALLGVEPNDIPPPSSAESMKAYLPFPLSYFQEQFAASEKAEGRSLTRADIQPQVRGFVAMCRFFKTYDMYYFYSTDLNRRWWEESKEVAVKMLIEYGEDPNHRGDPQAYIYLRVKNHDLLDDPDDVFGLPDEQRCIKRYLAEQGQGTPTPRP